MASRFRHLHVELLHHVPFTVFAVAAGMLLLGLLGYARPEHAAAGAASPAECPHLGNSPARGLFHLFHPVHLLLSATATTAMFWRFERKVIKAVLVGLAGSIGVCGISDIFMPFASGLVLGRHMELHVCLVKHPMLILPFAAVGIIVGFLLPADDRRTTIFSHSSHVFVSAMASLLYLISFGMTGWAEQAGWVLIFMVLSVVLPCCFSDIVFPLLTVSAPDQHHDHGACAH